MVTTEDIVKFHDDLSTLLQMANGHYAIKGSRDHMAGAKCDGGGYGVIKPDIYSLAIRSDRPNEPIDLSTRVSKMINEGATVETGN